MDRNTWTYKFIGDICEILNGFAFKSSEYVEQGIRVIRITNVQKGHIEDENPVYYPYDAEPLLKKYILKENDILMSLTGNVGRVGLLPENMLPAALNQRVACLRLKTEEVYFPFLYHYFNSDFFEQKCIESSRGIAQKNMSTEWLKEQAIPVPPLPTQRAIVAELDTLNEILDKKRQQLKELDTLAQSIFYDMFGDPVENEKGWEVKRLGEVCTVTSSKRVYQTEWKNYGIPFLRISDFTQLIEDTTIDTELFISMEKYKELNVLGQVPKSGDILVTSRGTLGNCYIINDNDRFYFQDGMITWLKDINKQIHPLLIKFLFKNNSFRKQIDKSQNGSTVAYLSISMLKKFRIPLPPLTLQQSFAQKIEAIEKQKELINASIKEVETLLNARMGYYFGE